MVKEWSVPQIISLELSKTSVGDKPDFNEATAMSWHTYEGYDPNQDYNYLNAVPS